MAFLSWISSREIEKSLFKTKDLANRLKLQNENLELIVMERTKELRLLQLKQLTKIAPLLDLGKLSAGLIHDIREPLSVLSLILQKAQSNKNFVSDIEQAFVAIDKIDDLSKMSACKLFDKPILEVFDLNSEIKKLIDLFEYKSKLKKVKIIFEPNKQFELHSDRVKLNQVLANLILNSLKAYDEIEKNEKYIFIKLIKKPRNLLIKVKDYGPGISKENLLHVFDANFSSKESKQCLGLGLYVGQEAMMKTYETKITVESLSGHGSTFTLFIKNKFILNVFTKNNSYSKKIK